MEEAIVHEIYCPEIGCLNFVFGGIFTNLTPSFRNQQIWVFNEFSVEMPAISISRDQ